MKKFVKAAAVVAAMMMAFAFVGCGSSSDDDDTTSSTTQSGSSTAGSTQSGSTAGSTTDKPAASANPFLGKTLAGDDTTYKFDSKNLTGTVIEKDEKTGKDETRAKFKYEVKDGKITVTPTAFVVDGKEYKSFDDFFKAFKNSPEYQMMKELAAAFGQPSSDDEIKAEMKADFEKEMAPMTLTFETVDGKLVVKDSSGKTFATEK